MPSGSFTGTAVLSGECKLLILLHGNTWKYTFVLKLTTVFAANEAGPKVCQRYDSLASIIPEVYWPSFKFRNVVSKIIMHKSIANLWI